MRNEGNGLAGRPCLAVQVLGPLISEPRWDTEQNRSTNTPMGPTIFRMFNYPALLPRITNPIFEQFFQPHTLVPGPAICSSTTRNMATSRDMELDPLTKDTHNPQVFGFSLLLPIFLLVLLCTCLLIVMGCACAALRWSMHMHVCMCVLITEPTGGRTIKIIGAQCVSAEWGMGEGSLPPALS